MLTAIAWRNLWRNKRRTALSLAAVAFPLSLVQCMSGMMHGMADRLVEAVTETQVGHIQVHQTGYRSSRGRWRTVADADRALETVRGVEGIEAVTGRIYGVAHASLVRGADEEVRSGGGEDIASPVVAVLGVDPRSEILVTDMEERVVEGHWLEGETDVLIGHTLARTSGAQIGDAFLPTVVDASGATRGPWAVSDQVPRIVGIVRSGLEEIDRRMVILPRAYLAGLVHMEGEVHEIAIRAESHDDLASLVAAIEADLEETRRTAQGDVLPATSPLAVESEGQGQHSDASAEAEEQQSDASSPAPVSMRLVGVGVDPDVEPVQETEENNLQGRFLSRADELVLSAGAAVALSAEPGDQVAVQVPVDCGEDIDPADCPPSTETFTVAGILSDESFVDGPFALVVDSVVSTNIVALAPSVAADLEGEDAQRVTAALLALRGETNQTDEVLAWYDIVPMAKQMKDYMDVFIFVLVFIIYIAVFLIISSTILMATIERTREFGLMGALGMHKIRVVAMVLTESALLALVGIVVGLALGLAVESYFVANGMQFGQEPVDMSGITIDPTIWPRIVIGDVIGSSILVFLMTTSAGLIPAIRASLLQPTNALRAE